LCSIITGYQWHIPFPKTLPQLLPIHRLLLLSLHTQPHTLIPTRTHPHRRGLSLRNTLSLFPCPLCWALCEPNKECALLALFAQLPCRPLYFHLPPFDPLPRSSKWAWKNRGEGVRDIGYRGVHKVVTRRIYTQRNKYHKLVSIYKIFHNIMILRYFNKFVFPICLLYYKFIAHLVLLE